jgi:hypothetical protein
MHSDISSDNVTRVLGFRMYCYLSIHKLKASESYFSVSFCPGRVHLLDGCRCCQGFLAYTKSNIFLSSKLCSLDVRFSQR